MSTYAPDNMMRFPPNTTEKALYKAYMRDMEQGLDPLNLPTPTLGAAAGPSNTSQNEQSDAPAAASRNTKKTEQDGTPKQTTATNGAPDIGSTTANTPAVNGKGKEKAGRDDTPKASTSSAAKPVPKPLNVPSANKATAKPSKSPTVSKSAKSPAEASAPRLAARTPERSVRQPEKAETPAAASSSNPSKSSSVKRPPPLQHTSSPGFVKPKPKSPTRPVKLPPGLTSHTAASGSKASNARQSAARTTATLQVADHVGRSPSRTSVSTSVSTTGTASTRAAETRTIKRQSSSIGRQRPSFGPPPKQPARDHPPTKKEREIDESFLARMTRPTQASASKTHEKVATTPPPRKPTTTAAKKPVVKASTVKRASPKVAVAGPSSEVQPSAESQATISEVATSTVVSSLTRYTSTAVANSTDTQGQRTRALTPSEFSGISGEPSGTKQDEAQEEAGQAKISPKTLPKKSEDSAQLNGSDTESSSSINTIKGVDPPPAESASPKVDAELSHQIDRTEGQEVEPGATSVPKGKEKETERWEAEKAKAKAAIEEIVSGRSSARSDRSEQQELS